VAEIFKVRQSSSMLERWNDDKMDALSGKVDDLGESMRELQAEIREERKQTRAELLEQRRDTKAGFDKRLERLHAGWKSRGRKRTPASTILQPAIDARFDFGLLYKHPDGRSLREAGWQ
jgi:hypothetical protein